MIPIRVAPAPGDSSRPGPVGKHTTGEARRAAVAAPRHLLLVAYGLTILLLGGSIPTPLYEVYQNLWRFSEGMLTVVYAVYVAGILAALPCAGKLSDRVGRRPVLLSALGVGSLIVARTLQGLARVT